MAFSESSGQPSAGTGAPPNSAGEQQHAAGAYTAGTQATDSGGTTGAGVGGSPTNDQPEVDWTDQVTDLVVETVDKVRSRTTGPVLGIARGSVYGIVAAIVAIPIVIAFFAGLVKGLNWLIPGPVWIVYAIIAAMLWVSGWIMWSKRDRAESTPPTSLGRS